MFEKMSVETLLERALGAAELRHRVIANNIANVDTPGFRAQRVAFEELLGEAIAGGDRERLSRVAARILPAGLAAGPDGNDVRLEDQIGQLLKNSGRYKAYMRILIKRYRQMELAINGQ